MSDGPRPDGLFDRFAREAIELQESFGRSLDSVVSRLVHGLGDEAPSSGAPSVAPALAPAPGVDPPFTAEETRLLEGVEQALVRGRDLKRWWDEVYPRDGFERRFELGRTFNEADTSFGFFDHAEVGGAPMPLMGNFQEMFYDRPKTQAGQPPAGASDWMRDQMRQFVLRYFMRVSDFRAPEGYADTWRPPTSGLFQPLSWCPRPDAALRGFGFQQLYYKRRGGEVGRFPEEQRFAIVDLRELGEAYEWIVVKVCIFDFSFTFAPFGEAFPKLVMPLAEDSYLVVSRDFVTDEGGRASGRLGRYGVGYSFVKNPTSGLMGYGPGEFDAAIETITFEVFDDGVVRVPMVFVANRPERVMNLRFDPVGWSLRLADLASFGTASAVFAPLRRALAELPLLSGELDPVYAYVELANLLSGGLSKEALCISREQLDKDFLVKHYLQHYETIAGSLATWRQIPDWLDTERLPEWVRRGKSL